MIISRELGETSGPNRDSLSISESAEHWYETLALGSGIIQRIDRSEYEQTRMTLAGRLATRKMLAEPSAPQMKGTEDDVWTSFWTNLDGASCIDTVEDWISD